MDADNMQFFQKVKRILSQIRGLWTGTLKTVAADATLLPNGCRPIPAGHYNFDPAEAVCYGLNEAIVMQVIRGWQEHNAQQDKAGLFRDGRWWTYRYSPREWQAKYLSWWSPTTVTRTFSSLRNLGLLVTDPGKKGQSLAYSLADSILESAVPEWHFDDSQLALWPNQNGEGVLSKRIADSIKDSSKQHSQKRTATAAREPVALFDVPSADGEMAERNPVVPEMRGERDEREAHYLQPLGINALPYPHPPAHLSRSQPSPLHGERELEGKTEPETETGADLADEQWAQWWNIAYSQLAIQLDRASFDTWLRDARLVGAAENILVVGVPNTYVRDMLQHRLYRDVRRVVRDVSGQREAELRFEVEERKPVIEGELPLFKLLAESAPPPSPLPATQRGGEKTAPKLAIDTQRRLEEAYGRAKLMEAVAVMETRAATEAIRSPARFVEAVLKNIAAY